MLTVVGATGTKKYTMAELKALPAVHGFAGIKTSVGTIYPPVPVTGVALTTLVDLVGGLSADKSVTLFAKDGYGMAFSYDQVMHHKFTAFDPATGDEVAPDPGMTMVLAYEEKGKPLDPSGRGTAAPGHGGAVDARPGRRRPLVGEVGRQGARWPKPPPPGRSP